MTATDLYADRGQQLLALSWVEFSIATVLIIMRIFAKVKIVKEGHTTCALALAMIAWSFGLIDAVFLSISIHSGLGKHAWLLDAEQIVSAVKWTWLAGFVTRISLPIGRAAVVAFIWGLQKTVITAGARAFLLFIVISNVGHTCSGKEVKSPQ
ncbi:MAG: hypothetical protein Q9159_007446 [Coniocarpon cinnabarinum]